MDVENKVLGPNALPFDYFYDKEPEKFKFYRIPAIIIEDEYISSRLSAEAKIIYGLFLSRTALSQKNGWLDEYGRVYIYFPIEELQGIMHIGKSTVQRALKTLDTQNGIGLIHKVRQGLGKPDKIYVMNFATFTDKKAELLKCQNETSGSVKTNTLEVPKSNLQNPQKENSRSVKNATQEVSKENSPYNNIYIPTYLNYKYINETILTELQPIIHKLDGICHSLSDFLNVLYEVSAYMRLYERSKESFPEEYEIRKILCHKCFQAVINTIKCSKETIKINYEDVPTENVKYKLLSANSICFSDTLDSCVENIQTLSNPPGWFLSALYNAAPDTFDIGDFWYIDKNLETLYD